ncbi:MAG: transcription termination factor Rho [Candidatus Aldehydirespiratoraceae bacterium]
METAEMRRSTLQRKDREELTLIATTLGKKPASRARKGEIIDLILDLAAGGDGSSVGGEPVDAPSDVPAEEAAAEDSETSDSASSEDGAESSDDSADKRSRETKSGDTRSDSSGQPSNHNAGSDNAGSDNAGSDNASNHNAGSDNAGSDNAGSDNDSAADGGNRKRRRRGRERENNRDSNDSWDGEPIPVAGFLELRSEGYGFLRVDGALPSKDDAYVPVKMVRQFSLRKGDQLTGTSRPANRNEKNPAVIEILTVNGGAPEAAIDRVDFDSLPAVYPSEAIVLAGKQKPVDATARVIDLLVPLGRGQRALLAGPPRSGKTSILQHVIRSIEKNHQDLELLVLLLDERPEDITEMTRWVEKGDVVASAFDRPADEQVAIAEMVIERAKRMVESGKDVVVIVDGITRLARAYAQEASGGRSGVSVDSTTVHPAKRFLGAARKLEGGASLTMLATISVDNGSATDATIYEELAGTANAEIRLDPAAAVRRIFPAIDIAASATVHEENLRKPKDAATVSALRAELAAIAEDSSTEASADLQALLQKITDRVL